MKIQPEAEQLILDALRCGARASHLGRICGVTTATIRRIAHTAGYQHNGKQWSGPAALDAILEDLRCTGRSVDDYIAERYEQMMEPHIQQLRRVFLGETV